VPIGSVRIAAKGSISGARSLPVPFDPPINTPHTFKYRQQSHWYHPLTIECDRSTRTKKLLKENWVHLANVSNGLHGATFWVPALLIKEIDLPCFFAPLLA
jgi:hypothetical protein